MAEEEVLGKKISGREVLTIVTPQGRSTKRLVQNAEIPAKFLLSQRTIVRCTATTVSNGKTKVETHGDRMTADMVIVIRILGEMPEDPPCLKRHATSAEILVKFRSSRMEVSRFIVMTVLRKMVAETGIMPETKTLNE